MCNPVKVVKTLIRGPDTRALEAQAAQAASIARSAQAAAAEEQKKSRDQAAEIAAAGATGTEKARKAAERRMRVLLENQGFGALALGGPGATPAPVGYRVAMGQ